MANDDFDFGFEEAESELPFIDDFDLGPTDNEALETLARETALANRVQADDSGMDIPTLPDPNAPD